MIVGFKTRIYPDEKQAEVLAYYCKVAHDMQNFLVAKYKDNLPSVSKYGINNYKEHDLMSEFSVNIPIRIVRGVLYTYAKSVQRFWNKTAKPPKFHKYNPNKQSFYMPGMSYKIINGKISIPILKGNKIGISKRISIDTRLVDKNNIVEVIEPRFTCYKGEWYFSGSYKVDDVKKRDDLEYIGLDWGIKNFMTTSDGELISYPESVLREFQRINRLKHYRDKKIKGSNNWAKVNRKINLAYDRLENLKRDFIEKTTTELCKSNNIVVEDLTNAKIKRTQRFIRRMNIIAPHYRFVKKLQWKCEKFGSTFIKMNPAYTSKTCSCCGRINHNLKLSDRVYVCECGNIMDRDVNAARNLVINATKSLTARAVCCS